MFTRIQVSGRPVGALLSLLLAADILWAQTDAMDNNDALEEIVVTATRVATPLLEVAASITVQDMEALRAEGFTYGTDEFRGVPGVFFRRGEGDGEEFPFISIRGVTGNHGNDTFLALIDGIPFVGPDEEVLLYEIPYAAVESIEIVRGPMSALYGRGAIAGAVNYRSLTPRENRNEFVLTVGNEDFFRAEGKLDRVFENGRSLLVSGVYEDFGGWRENSDRELGSIFVKGSSPVGERGVVTGWLTYYDRKSKIPSVIPTLGDGTIVDVIGGDETFLGYLPTNNDVSGVIAAARYSYQTSDQLSFEFTGQVRDFDSDVRLNFYDYFEFDPTNNIMGVNGFASTNDTNVYFAEAVMNWSSGRHTIVAGLSTERATLDESDRWSGEIDPFFSGECNFRFYAILIDYSTAEVLNDDPSNSCFVRDQLRTAADTTNTFYGGFVQDQINLTDRLELTLGLRYDRFDREIDFAVIGTQPVDQRAEGDADAVTPKVSLGYSLENGLVYGSYGQGFNSNFGPVWQWEPDQYAREEKPTSIDSYELGWKGRTEAGKLQWETALFYLEQSDRRIFVSNPDPNGPPTLATTGQKYSSQGLEAALTYRPTENTTALLTYTYLDPKWDELIIAGAFGGPDQDFSGVTPQGVPENMFYLELGHTFNSWLTGRVNYEWYDDYYVDLSNNVSAGSYDLIGASASISIPSLESLVIDVSVTNLLDDEYYFYFAGSRTQATNVSPGTPRLARIALRWQF